MNNNYDFDDMKRQKAAVLDMLGLTPNTPTTGTPAPDGDLEARLAQALRDMCQIAQIACGLGVISDMREDMTGPYPTAIRLLAEYDAARSGAAPIAGQRQTTHWDGCWRDSGHHACAVARIEELLATPAALESAREFEVRLNNDGSLDEVVGSGTIHLEQMDSGHWWLGFGEGPLLHVNLTARGKIKANVLDERNPNAVIRTAAPVRESGEGK